jgi:hypothetical protein
MNKITTNLSRLLLAVAVFSTFTIAFAQTQNQNNNKSKEGAQNGRRLYASLTGEAEVPGPGDPDGSGSAVIYLNQGQGEICYEITVSNIAPARAAHIHEAPAGQAGPVIIGLDPPTDGSSSGCVKASKELIKEIRKNPESYYVNVHNAEFPAGAVREQLSIEN